MEHTDKVLHGLLHQTVALKFQVQQFHWNVVGPNFSSLHKMLETVYEELEDATDEIGEKIRSHRMQGPFVDFSHGEVENQLEIMLKLGRNLGLSFTEENNPRDYKLKRLNLLNEAIISNISYWIKELHDKPSVQDFVIARKQAHEEHRYFLENQFTKASDGS